MMLYYLFKLIRYASTLCIQTLFSNNFDV